MTAPSIVAGWLTAAAVLVPLLLGLIALLPRAERTVTAAAPFAALPALGLALAGGDPWSIHVPWLLLGARFGLDLTGRVYLLLGAITFSLAALAAWRDADVAAGSRRRFMACLLPSAAGTFGMALSQDAVTFYVCFALLSFPAYGLVVFDRRAESRRAGRAYIAFVVLGEVLLVSGLFLAARGAGTTDLGILPARMVGAPGWETAVMLILVAFGMKAGAVPLHVWLPPAYTEAPTPGSAALAGVMSKAGVFGWLRLLPLGVVSLPLWGMLAVGAGLLAAFYGVLVGLTVRHPKTALAYSSVSQMGFMTTAIGIGLLAPSVWPVLLAAVLAYMVHHGLAKGALFLGVGAAEHSRNSGATPGQPREHPRSRAGVFILAGLGACGLSLAGAPLTSGAAAKMLLKDGFSATGMPSAASIVTLMSLAAIGTTLLMARFLVLVTARMREPDGAQAGPAPGRDARASSTLVGFLPWGIATALSLLSPWIVLRLVADTSAAVTLATTWPVVVGGALSAAAVAASTRGWRPPVRVVPTGDLLVLFEQTSRWAVQKSKALGRTGARVFAAGSPFDRIAPVETRIESAAWTVEGHLTRWRTFGALFAGLLLAVVGLLVW